MLKTVFGLAMLSLISATIMMAQAPPRRDRDERRGGADKLVAASVARMMALDADEDGKLSKAEVSDQRLASLFDRGDANHDGILTKDELTEFFIVEAASLQSGGPTFGGPPERFGGAEGGGPGGGRPGGQAGFGPPASFPRPGEVLPRFLQDELQLSRQQREQLEKLQADVDARLANILTDGQRDRLAELRARGPRGPGGPGNSGGRGERRPPRED